MTRPPLHLDRLATGAFQAWQDSTDEVFVVRETTDGWKTEGNPSFDGLLFATLDELTARLEGRD